MELKTEESIAILFKPIKILNDNEAEFIELFLEGGLLEHLFIKLVGCSTCNYYNQIYSETLNKETEKNSLKKLLENFSTPKEVTSLTGTKFNIQLNLPQIKQQIVTLFTASYQIKLSNYQGMGPKFKLRIPPAQKIVS